MVAKKSKKSTRGMKDLPAKKLSAKHAKGVKGGVDWGDGRIKNPVQAGKPKKFF